MSQAFSSTWIILFAVTCNANDSDDQIEVSSRSSAIEFVSEAHERIRNLGVVFKGTNFVGGVPAYAGDEFVHSEVRAMGKMRFSHLLHMPVPKGQSDPNEVLSMYDGDSFFGLYPYARVCSETAVTPETIFFTDKVRRHAFWESLGWWPPDDESEPPKLGETPIFLLDLMRNREVQAREITSESGRACLSITLDGVDEILFDLEYGQITSRRRFDPNSNLLVLEIESSNFRQLDDGIWLPYRIDRTFIDPNGIPNKSTYRVLRYQLNDLSEKDFQLPIEPGYLLVDRASGKLDQVPGGVEFLDTMFDREIVNRNQTKERSFSNGLNRPFAAQLVSVFVGAALGIALPLIYRRPSMRTQQTSLE